MPSESTSTRRLSPNLTNNATTAEPLLKDTASSYNNGDTPKKLSMPGMTERGKGETHETSRWSTLEYRFYLVIAVLTIIDMYWVVYEMSSPSNPNYLIYSSKLETGWLFGRLLDNNDRQYAGFRGNLPILFTVMLAHWLLSNIIRIFSGKNFSSSLMGNSNQQSPTNSNLRIIFSLGFSLTFLMALFGASVLKILAIITINYFLTKTVAPFRSKHRLLAPALIWTFCLGILFLNDFYRGYSFGWIGAGWLDLYRGIGIRWQISFNFCTLRMISFSCDYLWRNSDTSSKRHRVDCPECLNHGPCQSLRVESPLSPAEYSYLNYLAYVLYAPLYVAGPIITYNDFIYQQRHETRSITVRSALIYALRLIGCLLLMEFMMHTVYVVAIKESKVWEGFSPFQIAMIGYWNLKYIWLKLLIIWRFFRLWAMLDGVETVENMTRCMTNNYSAIGFWKTWHRSYNRWLIRYAYVPLGGSAYYAYNIWPIFTFVAIWHDIELKLLVWGWLIALFILPEFIFTKTFATTAWRRRLGSWHIHFCAIGSVINIWLMMAANLVGFAVGVDGMIVMVSKIVQPEGIAFLVTMFFCVYCGVHIMYEVERLK